MMLDVIFSGGILDGKTASIEIERFKIGEVCAIFLEEETHYYRIRDGAGARIIEKSGRPSEFVIPVLEYVEKPPLNEREQIGQDVEDVLVVYNFMTAEIALQKHNQAINKSDAISIATVDRKIAFVFPTPDRVKEVIQLLRRHTKEVWGVDL